MGRLNKYRNKIYLAGLLAVLLLFAFGYSSHTITDGTSLTISGHNWTAKNTTEAINFTIKNNETSNNTILLINITMNSGFTLLNQTIGNTLGWNCTNATLTRVVCNNASPAGLDIGEMINIWFNVTSPAGISELTYQWTINTTDNATNKSGIVLSSWVDGLVTSAAQPDNLALFMKSNPTINWTNSSGSDAFSGIANYTIYHSEDSASANYTINGTVSNSTKTFTTSGLSENKIHYFIIETRDNAGNRRNSSIPINTTIDKTPPTVSLSTTNNTNVTDTYYPRLYFNVTDNYDTNMNCTLFVDGYANGSANVTNATQGLSIRVNSSIIGTHIWNVSCTDDALNTGGSETRTINVVSPDIVVVSTYFTSTDAPNIADSSNVTVFALVRNVGNGNITQNVTVMFQLDGNYMGNYTIGNESITAGQEVVANMTREGNLKYYQSTFNHTLKANATAGGATELNTTNNYGYNYSLYVGYNVTITNINASVNPGVNETITVVVRYPNGTGAAGIPATNFTISDTYGGTPTTKTKSYTDSGDGNYIFQITTDNVTTFSEGDTTRPGRHTMQVSADGYATGKRFTGTDDDAYNLTAPMFDIIYKLHDDSTDLRGSSDLDESSSQEYDIYLFNNGSANLTNVNVTITYDTAVFSSVTESPACSTKNANVANSETKFICTITANTKALTASIDGIIYATATGSYNGNKYTYNNENGDDLDIWVSNVPAPVTPPQTTAGATTGTTTPAAATDYPNCETNDDCFNDEYCDTHNTCSLLTCAADEEATDHACAKKVVAEVKKDYLLTVTEGPTDVEIEHKEPRNVTFVIRNDGVKTVNNLNLELRLPPDKAANSPEWYEVINHSETLDSGIMLPVKSQINTSYLSIGTYEITAQIKADETDAATYKFNLKITPDDDEKTAINNSIDKLDPTYEEIYNKMQMLLYNYPNSTNLTTINSSLALAAEHMKNARLAISSGDYLSAYDYQKKAESLIVDIKSTLEKDYPETFTKNNDLVIYLVILAVIVATGFFGSRYYMAKRIETRPAGIPTALGMIPKETQENAVFREVNAIKGLIKGKENTLPEMPHTHYNHYNYYGKEQSGLGKKAENIIKRVAEIIKGKKKDPEQKTLYDVTADYNNKKIKKMAVTY